MPLVLALTMALAGRDVRLGDVVPVERLRRAAVGHLADSVVARIPPWRGEMSLTREAATALVHRRLPQLPAALLLSIAPCRFRAGDTSRRRFGVRPEADVFDVLKGATLRLRSTAGAVRVSRPVVALQSGRDGGRIFVRDADGQVLSVKFATEGR